MKIIADENIVEAGLAFSPFGEVTTIPASQLSRARIRDADILLVRSVTRVDESLLKGTGIRFVGTATIGTDHVDQKYLKERGIFFASAPGSNAGSVAEYVIAALAEMSLRRHEPLNGKRVGIVGCGHIGGKLAQRLPALGLEVRVNDPPLERRAAATNAPHRFVSLDYVLEDSDIITIHVPLTREGRDATWHLFDEAALAKMHSSCWLINTSRGPVVDNQALLSRFSGIATGALILDVWEGEPEPLDALVDISDLATPHIAGYSYDGKLAGTLMLAAELRDFLGMGARAYRTVHDALKRLRLTVNPNLVNEAQVFDLARQAYPIARDDVAMREAMRESTSARGTAFTRLRRSYPVRYAFERFDVRGVSPEVETAVTGGLGMRPV